MSTNENNDKPKLVNPKPEGQKHYENTSEYSKPHESKDFPFEHVDNLAFGEQGEPDHAHDEDGIADPGAIEMGKETFKYHQDQKASKEKND